MFELSDTNFWALQICQHTYCLTSGTGQRASEFGMFDVLLTGAVGEVNADYINPCMDHPL